MCTILPIGHPYLMAEKVLFLSARKNPTIWRVPTTACSPPHASPCPFPNNIPLYRKKKLEIARRGPRPLAQLPTCKAHVPKKSRTVSQRNKFSKPHKAKREIVGGATLALVADARTTSASDALPSLSPLLRQFAYSMRQAAHQPSILLSANRSRRCNRILRSEGPISRFAPRIAFCFARDAHKRFDHGRASWSLAEQRPDLRKRFCSASWRREHGRASQGRSPLQVAAAGSARTSGQAAGCSVL